MQNKFFAIFAHRRATRRTPHAPASRTASLTIRTVSRAVRTVSRIYSAS